MSKFTLALIGTPQGKMATIAYIILLVIIGVSIVYDNNRQKDSKKKLSAIEIFLIIVLILIAYMVQIYSISCMVLGKAAGVGCNILAWVNAIYVAVIASVALLSIFFRA